MTHTHAGSIPATALTEISVVTDNNSQRKGGDVNCGRKSSNVLANYPANGKRISCKE